MGDYFTRLMRQVLEDNIWPNIIYDLVDYLQITRNNKSNL